MRLYNNYAEKQGSEQE